MPMKKNKPELLAPAGNFEKLKIALHYGADAVYLAGKEFSLRNFSGNFSKKELYDAVEYAHKKNKKVYLALNIYSRNDEQEKIRQLLKTIKKINPDAVILSDPGIILMAKEIIPDIDIHLSTQSNTTNYNTAQFWKNMGIKRVNLARELSLAEINEIASKAIIETEVFIHGAMCISYSGRCLLSSFYTLRDSNRGLCSHPCRWRYSIVEEMRPNEYYPLAEDKRGSYIFNSKDLCMIQHLPEIIDTGITSLKIEGRMKGVNYLASVTKTYRQAIDSYFNDPLDYAIMPEWTQELDNVYHRKYCTGFFFNDPDQILSNYENKHDGKIHNFVGKIIKKHSEDEYIIEIRNSLRRDDYIEILSPDKPLKSVQITEMFDIDHNSISHAKPNTHSILKIKTEAEIQDIIRKIF
ncbi:MAG: U32 family peptidase [Desulfobacteraceae bacterium]|nr:U32 family peptidase [Desulfobacteraceae bacterium]